MTGVSYFLLALAALLLGGGRLRSIDTTGPLKSSPCDVRSSAGTPAISAARALFDGNLVRRSIENERRLRGEQYRDPGDHEAPSSWMPSSGDDDWEHR